MATGILGTKVGMTQIFDDKGYAIPVTIIKAGPCMITQKKNVLRDGYDSIQIGYLESKKKLNRPLMGHLKRTGAPSFRHLKEYRLGKASGLNYEEGQLISLDSFSVGQKVNVSGKTIGKGFTSTQKRHNFAIGPMTHGSKNHRQPGSIGAGTSPGRVIPGKRMAGHLGDSYRTIKHLEIVGIHVDKHLMLVKGAIPGKTGNLVSVSLSK
uniref:ribosomal protein L3 n=1 Tax=Timspurckia oligopyrenoides TaxID=708627 RepID=UPI001FCD4D96|nr:ribosomal protein L3 [Timspurckia oligopyrenoides]UNJ17542.1 ribosomal protein L3 [Timspurckia oligopyrenoides]